MRSSPQEADEPFFGLESATRILTLVRRVGRWRFNRQIDQTELPTTVKARPLGSSVKAAMERPGFLLR